MKKGSILIKNIALLLSLCLVAQILIGNSLVVNADTTATKNILTLGEDLSLEQRELIFQYLGISPDDVEVIIVTNEDEHELLNGIATDSQIGTRTFSCCYIEPTDAGGIHIKTVNLNWTTCEMIRNALVTSGINNCNVICVAPIEVSGTGSITGIFKAYETINGEEIPEEKKELASEELITTCEIAGTVGQEEASSLISNIKEEVITDKVTNEDDILKIIDKYIDENNLELTEEQKWALVELMLQISKQDYDIDEIKQAYADIKDTVEDVKKAAEVTKNIFEKLWSWVTTTWQKITGTYEEISQTEEYQIIKDKLGILAQTNDDLLGDNTVVTITENNDTLEIAEQAEENEELQSDEKETHWYDWIVAIFNSGNNKKNETETDEIESQTSEENVETTYNFDSFKKEELEVQEEIKEAELEEVETEENTGLLDYVEYDFESKIEESSTESDKTEEKEVNTGVVSFDDLTN